MPDLLDPGPPLTPAGERLVDAATELFYRHGIRAVGVDLIAERAGTTKKTLYDRFGSKDALVALYLRRRARTWQAFLADHTRGARSVDAVFDALDAWLADQDRGCAFVNAYAEIGGTDHPGVAVIRAEKEWMRELFTGLVDDERLGAQLHLLYEGATVMVTAGGQVDALIRAREAVVVLLGSAAAAAPPAVR